jgi:transcriptional regulator with XRE-family HTH domain
MTSLRALLAQNIKQRRRILGITQANLAEKVGTSTHYIGQIELENKFPTPEMLERIAAALEIDSPQLFSQDFLPVESVKRFQEDVLSRLGTVVAEAISSEMDQLQKMG